MAQSRILLQRALIALCLMFLAGCSPSTPCKEWELQQNTTNIPCFNTGRLVLGPDSNCSNLEMEIDRSRSGIRCYINLLFLQIPPHEDDPTRAQVQILFDDQEPWIVYPYLFRGGQRMLLPGDVADYLIQVLLEGYSFTIQIGRSKLEVIPVDFSESYQQLLDLPIEEDFQLEC